MPLTIFGSSKVISSNDPYDTDGPVNRISVTQEAVRRANYERSAQSTITLSQRAPGIWSLSASNSLELTQDSDNLRVVFGDAQNLISLSLNQVTTVAGGQSEHVDVFTFPTGFNRLLFDVSSGMIIDNLGNPIASGDVKVP